jgi:site-specific DNA-cytosine methylase
MDVKEIITAWIEPFITRYQGSHEGENPMPGIRFRMLKNHELKKAQGFPDDYVITGSTTEQTKQIGNAAPVNTAKALALAAMGAGGRQEVR